MFLGRGWFGLEEEEKRWDRCGVVGDGWVGGEERESDDFLRFGD